MRALKRPDHNSKTTMKGGERQYKDVKGSVATARRITRHSVRSHSRFAPSFAAATEHSAAATESAGAVWPASVARSFTSVRSVTDLRAARKGAVLAANAVETQGKGRVLQVERGGVRVERGVVVGLHHQAPNTTNPSRAIL